MIQSHVLLRDGLRKALASKHARLGAGLVIVGEALIIARFRPLSDFYFPFVWVGYILFLDGAVLAQRGRSLLGDSRRMFVLLFPVSCAFWWLFELFNQAVHNWVYEGAAAWTGLWYVGIASMDFSTVLPAVWITALAVDCLLKSSPRSAQSSVPRPLLLGVFSAGLLCIALPVLFPDFAFGLIWGCMFLLLDPVNCLLGRPSIVQQLWNRDWGVVMRFAPAGLICGFFWESWNFWSMPKWTYSVPHVGFFHIFEMPVLGYAGYLPFGLELFAMANFVIPFISPRLLPPIPVLHWGASREAVTHRIPASQQSA